MKVPQAMGGCSVELVVAISEESTLRCRGALYRDRVLVSDVALRCAGGAMQTLVGRPDAPPTYAEAGAATAMMFSSVIQ